MRSDDGLDDALRALLRAGDPAEDGSEPSREESAKLRRVVLGSLRSTRSSRWIPLTAAVAAVLLAAVLLSPEKASTPPGSAPAPPAVAEEAASEAPRQIRFATEQGTQIIWVLDPDLDLWSKES